MGKYVKKVKCHFPKSLGEGPCFSSKLAEQKIITATKSNRMYTNIARTTQNYAKQSNGIIYAHIAFVHYL